MEYKIALAGNPNVGKTSLYNRITHSFEHVGNWHGVTVSDASKKIVYNGRAITVTDLPGFYSMTVYSFEEAISRDNVLYGKNDVIIDVCEVNNLARNLYLALQLIEADVKVVLAINMIDELHKRGLGLDAQRLEASLNLPVVSVSAKYSSNINLLMDAAIKRAECGQAMTDLKYLNKLPLKKVLPLVASNAAEIGISPTYAAIKVLENDEYVISELKLPQHILDSIRAMGDMQSLVARARYDFIEELTRDIVTPLKDYSEQTAAKSKNKRRFFRYSTEKNAQNKVSTQLSSDAKKNVKAGAIRNYGKEISVINSRFGFSRLDKIVLNKYLALPIFFAVMGIIFFITFGFFGNALSNGIEYLIRSFIYRPAVSGLTEIGAPVYLVGLFGEGIIKGVGGVLVFLPQIILLFLFLALLEDSGYVSRVAFMTDGLFRKIGLSGRSVFTMLMGFGCSATAVLTARGLEDDRMRKKTVLFTPFMSCSARLPVYTAIISAFFIRFRPLIIFGLYVLGVVVAVILAAIFEKIRKLKSGKPSFIMEMPPYRFPTAERVLQILWSNAKTFIVKVGTVVFALNVIVWILSNFSLKAGFIDGESNAESLLESLSSVIAPVFAPLGFGDWRAVTALLSGLAAKETVISTVQSLGGVGELFAGSNAGINALTFSVFTLLYVPCVATLSAMNREIGLRWTAFGFLLQMLTAYAVALAIRLICLFFVHYTSVGVGIILIVLIASAFTAAISLISKRRRACSGGCEVCNGGCHNGR